MELYENEMQVSDMLMESLNICNNVTADLANPVNYTSLIISKRKNIELESELLTLKNTKTIKCQEAYKIELSLISEYKAKIIELENTVKSLTNNVNLINSDLRDCQDNIDKQRKSDKLLFENLNDCLEREEKTLEQRERKSVKTNFMWEKY